MSDQGERPSYDPAEVRRSITLCFSAKDLRELAEGLGAAGLPEGRGIQDVARDVVRHFERQGSLDRLVEALKQARPLMEWPAPLARSATATAAPAFPPPPPLAPLASAPEAAPAPAPEAPAPALAPVAAPAPAPAPEAASASAPAAAPAAAPTVVEPPRGPDAPLLRDPYAPVWPGTAAPREPARPVDGRKFTLLFAIAAVVIVVASVGAFLVGRAGSSGAGPAPLLAGTDAMAKGERPLRDSGPSRLAADAVRRSLGNLARGCDLPLGPNEEPGTELFTSAYEQCGMRPTLGRPPSMPRSTRPADSAGSPSAGGSDLFDPQPALPAPNRAAPATQPRKAPAAAPDKPALPDNAACVDRCSSSQKQCNRGCGSEPTLSSEYNRWQACQAQCLQTASKCRLSCQ